MQLLCNRTMVSGNRRMQCTIVAARGEYKTLTGNRMSSCACGCMWLARQYARGDWLSRLSSMNLRASLGLIAARPCGPCDGGEDSTRRRNGDDSLGLHTRRLHSRSATVTIQKITRIELTLLAGMAVHVRLQRAWSCEALIANLALVLFLSAG